MKIKYSIYSGKYFDCNNNEIFQIPENSEIEEFEGTPEEIAEPYKRDSKKIKSAREQLSLYAHALDWEEGLAVVVFKNDGTWDFEELEFDEDVVKWVRENQELILSTIQNEKNKRLEEEV